MVIKENKTEVYALGQHISLSGHKARRVIDQIRGRSYEETLMILELMPYRACYPIFKLVSSAAANASYILGSNEANLFISKAEVNEGTTMKRLKLRARGRSSQIKKPTCHITIGMKDISISEYEETFWFKPNQFLKRNSMECLKKTKRKNRYRALKDHDMSNNGGAWHKK
uniref:ribosomal protein L22 n=1 Tax=Lobelia zeylanica TaxID=1068521 RepID=UPI002551E2AE|nr:ribosomal protein L22 [Lobelia zeylanica]YP_010850281.1 ribosomal protein L22 [Lobelia zeylanica]WGH11711.1 ribosomal protein L22 [Lobelia zeylanica]WGH11712.1 ribosomal protein L22 [Lobelia zeylanica]